MARIRTIKPEFFTSEDVVNLSPLARLLFIGLWCEADREGRMTWKPGSFKLRYLPADDCDIYALCAELIDAGLVKLYRGGQLAYIPKFGVHQNVNPRETESRLPSPEGDENDASARVSDASILDVHAQWGGGRKGREGKGREHSLARAHDALTRELDQPTAGAPVVEQESGAPDLQAYLAATLRLHPRAGAEVPIARALYEMRSLLPPLAEYTAALETWATSADWLEENARFAPKPANWVKAQGWKEQPRRPARQVDSVDPAEELASARRNLYTVVDVFSAQNLGVDPEQAERDGEAAYQRSASCTTAAEVYAMRDAWLAEARAKRRSA